MKDSTNYMTPQAIVLDLCASEIFCTSFNMNTGNPWSGNHEYELI